MERAQSCGVFNSLTLCPTHDEEILGIVMADGREFWPSPKKKESVEL